MGRDYQADMPATVFLIRFSQDKHANLRSTGGGVDVAAPRHAPHETAAVGGHSN